MNQKVEKTGQAIAVLLIVLMILRINSYFMISENATITRVFKTGLRCLLTGVSILLVILWNDPKRPTRFVYKNILALFFYLMYLFIGFASILWSSDQAWSALQIAMDIECVVFVIWYWKALLIFNEQPRWTHTITLDYIMWVSIVWVAISFLIGAIVNPDLFFRGTHGGEVQRLGGWIINPNEMGMLMTVGAGMLYTNLARTSLSIWKILGWLMIVLALVLTQSRSSMISFFLTTMYFVMSSGKAKLIIPTLVTGALVAPIVFFKIFVKEGDVGEVMSMTGRIPFWGDLLTYGFTEKPLFGFGFMRIHHFHNFPSIHSYPGSMTHNTFLQVLLNLGIAGALATFFNMVFVFKAWFREKKTIIKHTGVGIFIGIFINSLTEFGIFGDANYGIMWWLFIIMVYVISAEAPKPERYTPIYGKQALRN
ncbi:MAG: O-antigen ligase family protein [Bacteroidota bacterium]